MDKALRHNQGKVELSYLLDFMPALKELCRVCTYGAGKYERDNWKKGGKPDEEYLDACLRHIDAFRNKGEIDEESGCAHLAHAIWNLAALMVLNRKDI